MEFLLFTLGGGLLVWCMQLLRATRDDVRALRMELLAFRRQAGHPPAEVPEELRQEG